MLSTLLGGEYTAVTKTKFFGSEFIVLFYSEISSYRPCFNALLWHMAFIQLSLKDRDITSSHISLYGSQTPKMSKVI